MFESPVSLKMGDYTLKAHFTRILSELMAGTALHHLIYISATAHPAALLAAVDMGAMAHCWLGTMKEHSIAHGKSSSTTVSLPFTFVRNGGAAGTRSASIRKK